MKLVVMLVNYVRNESETQSGRDTILNIPYILDKTCCSLSDDIGWCNSMRSRNLRLRKTASSEISYMENYRFPTYND